MKRDDSMTSCNGYARNYGYINGVLDSSTNPKNIVWSDLFLTQTNRSVGCINLSRPIVAHEFGHTIGLAHSSNSASLMKQGTTLSSPSVALDIAADATCTGEKGVSCVFATN